jgi:hypothetical protein
MPHVVPANVRIDTPVVWSPDCLSHLPNAEIWVGVRTPGTEVPARITVIRDAVVGAGASLVAAEQHSDEMLTVVHDPALLAHLASGYDAWAEAGFPDDPGQDRVVPYVFPTHGMVAGMPVRTPTAIHGRAGQYRYCRWASTPQLTTRRALCR